MNVRLDPDPAIYVQGALSPKMLLEVKGALIFTSILVAMTLFASIFQYIGGNSISHILPTTVAYSICAALGLLIYIRKKKGKSASGLSWLTAFLLTVFAGFARYNYALTVDWQYAVEGIHINAVVIVSLIVLQFLYRRSLYLVFFVAVFVNWILFLYLANLNGVPMYMEGIVNGVAQHGRVVLLVQAYYILMMIIVGFINYKNIPVIEDFDALTSQQHEKIMRQSEQQVAMALEVKNRMVDLFDQVKSENGELSEFNSQLQSEVSTFEEISATIEELTSSAEKIHEIADNQVDASTKTGSIMEEFFKIKNLTKEKLRASLENINTVVNQIGTNGRVIENVENSILEIKNQSDKMSEMVALIVDIAERINMLSLNASIEAARAGERGQGFAVVAAEIGKMANRTAESVRKIEEVLGQNRHITELGVNTIREASVNLKAMMDQMLDSTQKINYLRDNIMLEEEFLQGIDQQMKMNLQLSRETDSGVREQTVALENTNRALENLNNEVAAMADGINRVSLSVATISDNARSLIRRAEETIS